MASPCADDPARIAICQAVIARSAPTVSSTAHFYQRRAAVRLRQGPEQEESRRSEESGVRTDTGEGWRPDVTAATPRCWRQPADARPADRSATYAVTVPK